VLAAPDASPIASSMEIAVEQAYFWAFAGIAFVLLLLWARQLDELRRRGRALGRIEMKLDLLMQQAGVTFEPYRGLPPAAVAALMRDQKITAIKHYRAATNASLREAKQRIEEAQRRAGL
jgi:hypothetical protein